jgi:hypothetical protein
MVRTGVRLLVVRSSYVSNSWIITTHLLLQSLAAVLQPGDALTHHSSTSYFT